MPKNVKIERFISEFNDLGALGGENTHPKAFVFEHDEAMTSPNELADAAVMMPCVIKLRHIVENARPNLAIHSAILASR
jgi:hypothetical protein